MTKLFDDYLFRCHSIFSIIPNQKTKAITKTIEGEYRRHFSEWMTGKKAKINSRYFDKGIACEPQAISLLQECLYPPSKGHGLISRKKVRKENGYVTGEHDAIVDGIVWDIKNAYSDLTFMNAHMTDQYEYQLQCYMWLNDLEDAALFYALIDTPEFLIDRDLKRDLWDESKSWIAGDEFDENYINYCESYRRICRYSEYKEPWERFKIFRTKRDENKIDIIKESVLIARENLNAMYDDHIWHIENNRRLMGIEDE